MTIHRRDLLGGLGAGALAALAPGLARSQDQALRILVGYPPGGAVDVVARDVGEALRKSGATVLVENRTGAAGRLATEQLLQAPADGNTLVLMPGGNVTIFEHVYPKLRYSLADLAPVSSVCSFPFALVVGPGAPVKTLAEFVAWARTSPGKASYGSPGAGTAMHFMGVMFARQAGIPLQHVPYRGGAAAMSDLMGGTLPAFATTLSNVLQPHRAGKLRILAITSEKRMPGVPDVPTFAELGYPELVLRELFGFFASAKVPEPALARLEGSTMAASRQPQVVAALEKLEYDPQVMGRAAFTEYLRRELERWGPIIRSTGYKAEE